MKIKTRLSLYFTLISCGALLLVLLTLCFAMFGFLKADFNKRLADRVNIASQLYLEADEIDADSLVEIQQRYLEKLPDEVIRVYNKRNKAAFNATNGLYWNDSVINQVRQKGAIEYVDSERQVVGKYYHDNQGSFVILASAVDRNIDRRMATLSLISAILFVGFSAILFFAGRWFAKNALAPIQSIVNQMRNIRSNNLHLRISDNKNKDEIAELISNFNNLLHRLENAFELQQSFVSNASHELRTPLTSIVGEAEVALKQERSIQEYERVLKSVTTDAMHLQETITSLMELAQVDANYTQATLQPLRVDELLWEINDLWQNKKGRDLFLLTFAEFPEDEQMLQISGNKPLLLIAINNIIDNAFKYSGDKPVQVYFESANSNIKITVTDSGPGIKQEDLPHIFKSFYRSQATRSVPGNGVGLYITYKIIQLCGGTVEVVPNGDLGSTFILQFPTAING